MSTGQFTVSNRFQDQLLELRPYCLLDHRWVCLDHFLNSFLHFRDIQRKLIGKGGAKSSDSGVVPIGRATREEETGSE